MTETNNLVRRLKEMGSANNWEGRGSPLCDEAADEIERLTAEVESLKKSSEMDKAALKAADIALANTTAFEEDARYIMGNTNFEITKHCRDEIRARLDAIGALE